jgi:hypothetical protein
VHGPQIGPRKDTGFHRDGDRVRDDREPRNAERSQDNGWTSHSRTNSISQTNVGNTLADVDVSKPPSAVWAIPTNNVDDLDAGWGDVVFGTSGVESSTNRMHTSIEKGEKGEATADASAPKSSRISIDEGTGWGWGMAAWTTTEPNTGENNNSSTTLNVAASDAATQGGRSSFTTTTSQATENNRKKEASAFSNDGSPFPKLTEQPRIQTAANKIPLTNSRWGRETLVSPSEKSAISRPADSAKTPTELEPKKSVFSPLDTRNSSTVDPRHITSQTKDNDKDPRAGHSKRVSWDHSAQKARLDPYFRTPFSSSIKSPGKIRFTKRDRG